MIITERRFHCKFCGFTKILKDGEIMTKCPAHSEPSIVYMHNKEQDGK
jgi:hypothetical protein